MAATQTELPPPTELLDLWGHPVHTASTACIHYINAHYLEVLAYGSNQKIIFKAVQEDPKCALAHVLVALHSLRSSTDEALSSVAAAKCCLLHATQYERKALNAAEALITERWDAALLAYSEMLDLFPKDLVSLKRAQVLCFYMGKCEESLCLSSKVLHSNTEEAYIYGMHAFALLETRRFDEAEEAARTALKIKGADNWAQHALCHVLQYRCLFEEAIRFMERNKECWSNCCSFMYSHNWWHLAVCYLEWGHTYSVDRVIEIYDNHLWPSKTRDLGGSVQGLLSVLGLLLRLQVRGLVDGMQGRILTVAQQVQDISVWHKERLLDVLMVWALSHVGESHKSRDFLQQLHQRVGFMKQPHQESFKPFLRLAEGLHEYGRGNVKKSFHVLGLAFTTDQLKVIGASDEQLDVFEELWCLVALRSGHFEEAYRALKKRTGIFAGSPFSWELLAECHDRMGSSDEAHNAATKASIIKRGYSQFMAC